MLLVEHLTLMPLLLPLHSIPQRRAYRDLIRHKRETFCTAKSTPSVHHLTNCGAPSTCCWAVVASGYRMTSERRTSIDISRRRSLVCAHCWCTTASFTVRLHHQAAKCGSSSQLPVADVTRAVQALADKQCSSDLVSTHVLKSSIDFVAPFLV